MQTNIEAVHLTSHSFVARKLPEHGCGGCISPIDRRGFHVTFITELPCSKVAVSQLIPERPPRRGKRDSGKVVRGPALAYMVLYPATAR